MKVAYLACADVLTTSANRRIDADEHDRELACLTSAFAARGSLIQEVDWLVYDPASRAFDLLFVRTTWDYVEHGDEFLRFIARAEAFTPVANAPDLIRWNLSKRYLAELSDKGLPIIPSLFTDRPLAASEAFDRLGAEELVFKPVVGASGLGQSRLTRAQAQDFAFTPDLFAQPLIPEITTEGEISYIFIAGAFSHAVRKTPAKGEFRIHIMHGGSEAAHSPAPTEIAVAQRFIDALPTVPLAARVDMTPHKGELLLMELELIEPHLFPHFSQDLGERVAAACEVLLSAA